MQENNPYDNSYHNSHRCFHPSLTNHVFEECKRLKIQCNAFHLKLKLVGLGEQTVDAKFKLSVRSNLLLAPRHDGRCVSGCHAQPAADRANTPQPTREETPHPLQSCLTPQ